MPKKKQVVLSGIRPTGKMHLGNYLGAMANFVELQNSKKYECFYFAADYHTLTTNPDPEMLKSNLPEIIIDYLAAGIDPEKSTLYVQSSVPEIAELSLLLSMVTLVGELERCPTYKEKKIQQPENVNHGLLSYPVLMAADILGPKADLIPVGKDQDPHVELARVIAHRFNHRYGETFKMPQTLKSKAPLVVGLDGTNKMSKSRENTIDLTDSPEIIQKKIQKAVTDPQRKHLSDPGRPYLCNVFALHELVSDTESVEEIKQACQQAKIGCVECKNRLAKSVSLFLKPFQEKKTQLAQKPDFVREVLRQGGQKARKVVQKTVCEVREKMGLINY